MEDAASYDALASFVLGGQVEVMPTPLIEEMSCQVMFMDSLHNHDTSPLLRVIESRRHGIGPPINRSLAHNIALTFFNIMRIIHNKNIAAFSSIRAVHRSSHPIACLIILKLDLFILISRESEHMPPSLLIPG